MGDQDAFERILASLHDAMLDDSRWPGTRLLCRRSVDDTAHHTADRHDWKRVQPAADTRRLIIASISAGVQHRCRPLDHVHEAARGRLQAWDDSPY